MGLAGDGGVQREPVPIDGERLGPGVCTNEGLRAQGERLLPAVGSDGDAITHRS